MHLTARTTYALRATLALAAADPAAVTARALAASEQMPLSFLKTILSDLRGAELIASQRGPDRGYRLTRPPADITVGDVLRIADGPLAEIHEPSTDPAYSGAAVYLSALWLAADTAIRGIIDTVTLADVIEGHFPEHIQALLRPSHETNN